MSKRSILSMIAATLGTAMLSPAWAGGSVSAAAVSVLAAQLNGATPVAFITPSKTITGTPSCNIYNRFAVNLSAPGAREIYATALMAKSTGSQGVTIAGTGACDVWSDSETAYLLYVQ